MFEVMVPIYQTGIGHFKDSYYQLIKKLETDESHDGGKSSYIFSFIMLKT